MKELSDQYIAGFLDGEGYFGIMKLSNKNLTLGYYYCPVVKVAQRQRDAHVLDLICEKYGGYVEAPRVHKRPNQSNSVVWVMKYKKHLKSFLENLKDHLIVKRKQTDVLLEFIDKFGHCPQNKTIEYDRERTKLYNRIRKLNHRGTKPAETE